MKITIEQLMRTKMQSYKVYHIENAEIIFYPKSPSHNKYYEVFYPSMGIEKFCTKQKAINYMMNDLQL